MIKLEDCYKLGIIQKPHGIEGEVVLKFNQDIIKAYFNMESIFIDLDGGLVPFLIYSLQESSSDTLITKLELVDTPEQAGELTGLDFYVHKNQLPDHDAPSTSWQLLIGFEVFDNTKTRIGVVDDVLIFPNNAVLRILNNAQKEILFPLDEALIQNIDEKNRRMFVHVPTGLLDINNEE